MGTHGSDLVSEVPPADLSLVVPCFQCRDTIDDTVDRLTVHLESLGLAWEVVLVDDGSTDGTDQAIRARADGDRVVAVCLPRNRGKGSAVAAGMLRARGACRIFTDADLPYELDAIERCVSRVRGGSDAVFGNRLLDASDARSRSPLRKALGGMVRKAAGMLLGRADIDTQCGFKGFSGSVAEVLFTDLRTAGFLFDVEVTRALVSSGARLEFLPVRLVNQGDSTVHLIPTALRSLREAWGLLRRPGVEDGKVEALRRALAPELPPDSPPT